MNRNCRASILAFVAVFLTAGSLHAKVIQPGRVRLQNSGSKPLAGVQVAFHGANRTTSDDMGMFILEFPDKKDGDEIVNPRVSKPGYEWVNEPSFRNVAASTQSLLELVMCPAGQLDANRQKYYEVAEAATYAALEKRLKALESKMKNDQVLWQREKDSLTVLLEHQLLRAREMADDFSRMNFDDASELHRHAFDLFQKGDIDSALHLLEGARLTQQAGMRMRKRDTLNARIHMNDQGIQGIIKAMMLHSRLRSSRSDSSPNLFQPGSDSAFGLDTAIARIAMRQSIQERVAAAFQADSSEAGTHITVLGLQSWLHLFSRQFHQSDSFARAALTEAESQWRADKAFWIKANLAHALLYQGRYSEAEAIYRDLKDRLYPFDTTKTFTPYLIDDFNALEKAGIAHPDVAKIRALLGATPATKPELVTPAAPKGKS